MDQLALFDDDDEDVVFADLVRRLAMLVYVHKHTKNPPLTLDAEVGLLRAQVKAISGVDLYA